jgi:hypothetical protein
VTSNNHPLGAPPESPDSFTHAPDEPTEPPTWTLGRPAVETALEDEEDANLLAQDSALSDNGLPLAAALSMDLPTLVNLGSSTNHAAMSLPR